jgi:tetratricopeptide (TPR) repeat protein
MTLLIQNCRIRKVCKSGKPLIKKIAVSLAAVGIVVLSVKRINSTYRSYGEWAKTETLYYMHLYREAIKEYEKQYPYLQDEMKFLFQYAQCYSKTEQYAESNRLFEQAARLSCDPMLHNIMGKNRQALKEYSLAEQSFTRAANLAPSRLYPYYLLAKLYHETGDMEKFRKYAAIVQTKEPKVHSKAVEEMREELRIGN